MKALTALIVDDHAEIRGMIAKILVGGGFDVIGEAGDGAQAVAMAARLIPDVITLDVSMPGMNGLDTLSVLREELPGAVIVMLTMNGEYERQARQRGADAYIRKPRAPIELISAIRAACESSRPISGDDAMDRLVDLQARIDSARNSYAASRREAAEASTLSSELLKADPGNSDGKFAARQAVRLHNAAREALREHLDALAELRRFKP